MGPANRPTRWSALPTDDRVIGRSSAPVLPSSAHWCGLRRLALVFRGSALVALALLMGISAWAECALAGVYRVIGKDGVVYLTNVHPGLRSQQQNPRRSSSTSPGILERAKRKYAGAILGVAARYGVDPRLIEAMIGVESAFNLKATSPKGARGLMQLMPRTATALGIRDPSSPRQNIEGGVRYLRSLIDRYRGNLRFALAAYNAGPRAVDRHRGIPPFQETREYVRRVLELYRRSKDLTPLQTTYRYTDAHGSTLYTNIPPSGSR